MIVAVARRTPDGEESLVDLPAAAASPSGSPPTPTERRRPGRARPPAGPPASRAGTSCRTRRLLPTDPARPTACTRHVLPVRCGWCPTAGREARCASPPRASRPCAGPSEPVPSPSTVVGDGSCAHVGTHAACPARSAGAVRCKPAALGPRAPLPPPTRPGAPATPPRRNGARSVGTTSFRLTHSTTSAATTCTRSTPTARWCPSRRTAPRTAPRARSPTTGGSAAR